VRWRSAQRTSIYAQTLCPHCECVPSLRAHGCAARPPPCHCGSATAALPLRLTEGSVSPSQPRYPSRTQGIPRAPLRATARASQPAACCAGHSVRRIKGGQAAGLKIRQLGGSADRLRAQISKSLLGDDQRLRLPRFMEDEAKDPEQTKQVRPCCFPGAQGVGVRWQHHTGCGAMLRGRQGAVQVTDGVCSHTPCTWRG